MSELRVGQQLMDPDLMVSRAMSGLLPSTETPIVPKRSISGRALVAVVAIMTFLASLTAGAVMLVRSSAAEWQSEVSREVTIQVRPVPGRDIEVEVARAAEIARGYPGIADVRPYSKDESARLLEPWLGDGLSLDDLPVPRMIVVRLVAGGADLAPLRKGLAERVAGATLDDHRGWIERMRMMAQTTIVAGIGVLLLTMAATVLSVIFATRGAMATNRPIVEVLHFVGAGDSFIANHFLRHFLRLGLEGGVIGGGAAMLAFGFSESIAGWFSGTPVGDQFAALLGTFSLRPSGYLVLAIQAVAIAAITAWASRRTLLATLDDID